MQIMLFSCFKTICGIKSKLANLAFKGHHSLVIYPSGLFPLAPSPSNMLLPVFTLILSISLVKMNAKPDEFAFIVQFGKMPSNKLKLLVSESLR